ncbi:MAG: helix-turn-helix transcriptional regulator [Bacteroidales bacterium]|nr:helix-turn-helix transcriptional regulator [Bacteroidales bacterium]
MGLGATYFYGLAATVFLTTSLVIAAVRWFHLCKPYNLNPGYYYPGRPFVIAVYLNALLLIPYILRPEDPDAWYLVRIYFLPVTLLHFTILMFSYFGGIMQWGKWRGPMIIIEVPVFLVLVVVFCLSLVPNFHIEDKLSHLLCDYILFALGAVVTLFCLTAMFLVVKWSKSIGEDDYSNTADFPVVAAKRWLLLVIVNIALCWIGAGSESKMVLALCMLLFAASSVIFIISALHPHRRGLAEDEETGYLEDGENKKEKGVDFENNEGVEDWGDAGSVIVEDRGSDAEHIYSRTISQQKKGEILEAIRTVVEEQEAFLDPHLTLQDVADRSGYNRTYVSGLIKSEYGSFFSYINRMRLVHVDKYQKDNPSATIQEAVIASGFNSRQAYYSVKKRLESDS